MQLEKFKMQLEKNISILRSQFFLNSRLFIFHISHLKSLNSDRERQYEQNDSTQKLTFILVRKLNESFCSLYCCATINKLKQ